VVGVVETAKWWATAQKLQLRLFDPFGFFTIIQ
jgi:hypothetical protein